VDGDGAHPLAGVYNSKADFLKHTFERLARIIKGGSVIMKIDHIYVSGDIAIQCKQDFMIHSNGKIISYNQL
jgi:hypothetical protein